MPIGYAARGHPHSGPEQSSNMRLVGTIAEGGGVCPSPWTGVKLCRSGHHALLCLQSGCAPGTLTRKVLQIGIADKDT